VGHLPVVLEEGVLRGAATVSSLLTGLAVVLLGGSWPRAYGG
jgi:hypothetical protein